jgi:16S rRNA (cytosine1402-N4)-methyltransferase
LPQQYGDERQAPRIAKAIVHARERRVIESSAQLAEIVRSAIPYALQRDSKTDAATKTFQALRIYLNDEIHELRTALVHAERALRPRAKLAVISFHSSEDRTTKQFLTFCGNSSMFDWLVVCVS